MLWYIQTNPAPAWQLDMGDRAPNFLLDVRASHTLLCEGVDLSRKIITDQVELMNVVRPPTNIAAVARRLGVSRQHLSNVVRKR